MVEHALQATGRARQDKLRTNLENFNGLSLLSEPVKLTDCKLIGPDNRNVFSCTIKFSQFGRSKLNSRKLLKTLSPIFKNTDVCILLAGHLCSLKLFINWFYFE